MKTEQGIKNRLLRHGSIMETIAVTIVRSRYFIFLLFAAAAVYCVLSLGKVNVNSELTAFLPADAETRQGLTVMEEEFTTYAAAQVMVSNITYDTAEKLSGKIKEIGHVTDVSFDDTQAHFKNASALFSVSFDAGNDDAGAQSAMEQISELIAPYDHYTSTEVGSNYSKQLSGEMGMVILFSVLVIIGVLLLTSHSYFEVVIFFIVFIFAGLLNMGTNFWLGTISSITNSVAVILQLALAIDYAIIFAHRYEDEASAEPDVKEALIRALSKSIVEISSSSLTTIAGLAALTMMQFRLGYDLGVVLMKGIVCSMLSVFLLMPGLILLFPTPLKKTAHRSLVPNIEGWGRLLAKRVPVFLLIFALVLPAAVICSRKTVYGFSDSSINELIPSESRTAMHKINDTFDPSTAIAVLVPSGDFEKEKIILEEAAALDAVKSATGLANIEIEEGRTLTDRYTPRMFSELLDVDIEIARLLFQAYGLEHEQYGAIFNSASYDVPLIDMLLYLFEKLDQGAITLTEAQNEMLTEMRGSLERADNQLRGENWDRLVLTTNVPAEGEESLRLVQNVRTIAEKQYGEGNILIMGEITSASDLRDSYQGDSVLISILTIVFVFTILLFTFRSPVAAALLVFVIQGSIWINFSVAWLECDCPSFVTNMIVSAIQMGATVDYAIVIMSHYRSLREHLGKREAMIRAVNESFPTVLTSGLMMTAAGLLIAYRVSDVYIGHIGLAVGRGAAISVILVLTVLPQMIVLFDKAIGKTTVKLRQGGGN